MSTFRVATAYSYDRTIDRLQQRQAELAEQQDKLSSGKRVRRVSDDPAAAALAEREQARMQRVQSDQRALEAARRNLELAESTLANINDLYHRAKELLVQGGNGALNDSDRRTIAEELEGIRERILALANTPDTSGRPLFMGLNLNASAVKPFVEQPDSSPPQTYGPDGRIVNWLGQSGHVAPTETRLPMVFDGEAIFGPSGIQANESIWETLDRAIIALRGGVSSPAALAVELGTAHDYLGERMDALLRARGQLGDWLNRADQMEAAFRERENYHVEQQSRLTDLDMLEAISRFQTLQLGYQAGLSSYAQVQRLSLFQYLA
ncbi:flagellar hook-associated protein FlgL [Tepidimonas sp.]|uniref:flagellar hook-associated protein FlgL n=1 Tax=Tepidimonas sp. TaxID=2002775 RepID=UPI002FDF0AD2